ncbi:MAG: HAD family hydrolase [Planctomycetota bacterium]|jgi:putative hydrolase of the HAD superfamily|nr:MAG: HAD family hydrolase [Planctomycetota bacterium]
MLLQNSGNPFDSPTGRQIKVVALDAVGTVMYAMPSVATAYCEILHEPGGESVNPADVRAVLSRRLAARSGDGNLHTTEASERAFWFDLIAELVPDLNRQTSCFEALFDHFANPAHWRCYEDVAEALESLQSSGLKIVLASNFDKRLHAVCNGLPELSAVSERIISSEVGWRKPARQFFEIVCQRTGTLPQEVLFVGDDPLNDIQGASLAGMPAAWIDRRHEPPGAVDVALPPAAAANVWRIGSLKDLVAHAVSRI